MPIDHVQTKLAQQKLNNAQVKQNLAQIEEYAKIHSSEELITWLKDWSTQPNLTMNNTLFWGLIIIAVILTLLLMAFGLPPVLFLLPIILIGIAFYKKASNKARNSLTEQLVYHHLEEKYSLKFNHNHLDLNDEQLLTYFPLFDLGNHQNEIRYTASGTWLVGNRQFLFTLFQYHYVEKRTSRDKDGNTTTSYHNFNKWGVFVGNLPIQGISISTEQKRNSRLGQTWTTSDIQFNKKYTLSGTSELNLARFFTPSRTLILENVLAPFRGDFYIHPEYPILCWLFSKNIFSRNQKSSQVTDIQTLIALLENMTLPEYEQLQSTLLPLLEKLE